MLRAHSNMRLINLQVLRHRPDARVLELVLWFEMHSIEESCLIVLYNEASPCWVPVHLDNTRKIGHVVCWCFSILRFFIQMRISLLTLGLNWLTFEPSGAVIWILYFCPGVIAGVPSAFAGMTSVKQPNWSFPAWYWSLFQLLKSPNYRKKRKASSNKQASFYWLTSVRPWADGAHSLYLMSPFSCICSPNVL